MVRVDPIVKAKPLKMEDSRLNSANAWDGHVDEWVVMDDMMDGILQCVCGRSHLMNS